MLKKLTANFDKKIVFSAAAGVMVAGLIFSGIRMLPKGNVVTDTLSKAADLAQ